MRNLLTAEESAKLIELGVSRSKANGIWLPHVTEVQPFTLIDILDILPKEPKYDSIGRPFTLHIREYKGDWRVWYARDGADVMIGGGKHAPELIDALYSLLVWCLEKGYVK
ncbi:hypothetical protein [Paramuribaculum intestinale]|uniref:hypothetical protein n=1 Tax=Paramuribaculum intestinale TaxID=2094151 RepID=UPI0025A9495F|nr:hypothetical protein [Paramuribaculum intestinale]